MASYVYFLFNFCNIAGNIMDNIVSAVITGVDSMFHQPHGCGEQTMIYTAPIVYGMYYIKQTGQETAENEQKGTKFLQFGKHSIASINYLYFTNDIVALTVWGVVFV